MTKLSISVEPRKILGKKVKKLRGEGILPANLFGKDIKSKSLQVQEKDFRPLFKSAGETGVVEIKLKSDIYPALIHNVQRSPVTDKIIHVDFHKVNLKEKITTHVPIKLVGESPSEKSGTGLLLQTINELEIESLPTDIPPQIEVDTTKLEEVGQTIQVKDLKIDRDKVDVKNSPEDVVVSVQTAEMKEAPVEEEAPSPEDVEATAEKGKEEEAAEDEEKPAEEKKETPKAEEQPNEEKTPSQEDSPK
ncbi:50S ribosomal protein L25 [Patescibacteria group bacterium]|nr:50S ribosomal protein L25 [Patescibacteria group bacterium]